MPSRRRVNSKPTRRRDSKTLAWQALAASSSPTGPLAEPSGGADRGWRATPRLRHSALFKPASSRLRVAQLPRSFACHKVAGDGNAPDSVFRRGFTMTRLMINGTTIEVEAEPETPLLWVIRENIGLTGTKYGCGIAQCGACTVHLDGAAVRSCSVQLSDVSGKKITTIEGLAKNGVMDRVQKAWIENDVPQCGYCQSGMIMAVAALLNEKPHPTDTDIDEAITNICRCGTFKQVRESIHAAANA